MSSFTASRSLLSNVWYLTSEGFKQGFVFLRGTRIEDVGEEPPPEYELAELVYNFESSALVVHGYSLIVDLLEYVTRMIGDPDISTLTKQESKKLVEVGIVNAYINGVTLPIAVTKYPEVVGEAARQNGVRVGVIAERGTVSPNPFLVVFEVDNGHLYYEDSKLGPLSTICRPETASKSCLLVDARGYGNVLTAIEEVYRSFNEPLESYKLLTNPYKLAHIDGGFVEKGSASDVLVYDLRNPLKAAPILGEYCLYKVLSRSQQPDIVFIGGDVFYEFGENLAIPLVKVMDVVKKVKVKPF
ncbi:MAG: hypothetical protein ACP5KA_04370 [Desulfurococcaceae archaeon]